MRVVHCTCACCHGDEQRRRLRMEAGSSSPVLCSDGSVLEVIRGHEEDGETQLDTVRLRLPQSVCRSSSSVFELVQVRLIISL